MLKERHRLSFFVEENKEILKDKIVFSITVLLFFSKTTAVFPKTAVRPLTKRHFCNRIIENKINLKGNDEESSFSEKSKRAEDGVSSVWSRNRRRSLPSRVGEHHFTLAVKSSVIGDASSA